VIVLSSILTKAKGNAMTGNVMRETRVTIKR